MRRYVTGAGTRKRRAFVYAIHSFFLEPDGNRLFSGRKGEKNTTMGRNYPRSCWWRWSWRWCSSWGYAWAPTNRSSVTGWVWREPFSGVPAGGVRDPAVSGGDRRGDRGACRWHGSAFSAALCQRVACHQLRIRLVHLRARRHHVVRTQRRRIAKSAGSVPNTAHSMTRHTLPPEKRNG